MDTRRWNWVLDLRKEDGQGWNEELIRKICNEESIKANMRMNWSETIGEDLMFWCGNPRGLFSVNNYFELNCIEERQVDGIWKSLWKSKVHERLKIFGWKVLANALPTRELLGRRLGLIDTSCLVCGNEMESSFHLFKECPRVRVIAFASRWGGRID